MKKPVSIWIAIVLISIFGLYSAWYALGHNAFLFIWTVLSFTAVYGLFNNKSWSQYLVYTLAAAIIFKWLYTLFSFQYRWLDEYPEIKIIFLLTGLFFVILALASCIIVFRYFRKQRKNP